MVPGYKSLSCLYFSCSSIGTLLSLKQRFFMKKLTAWTRHLVTKNAAASIHVLTDFLMAKNYTFI